MKKIILILSIIFIFFSCELVNLDNFVVANDTKENSISSLLFGKSFVKPPVNLEYIVNKTSSGYIIKIYWQSVYNAEKYRIYMSDSEAGEYKILENGEVEKPVINLPEIVLDKDELQLFYKVSSVGHYNKEGAKSSPLKIVLKRSGVYDGKVYDLMVSFGTKKRLNLFWTSAVGAKYYKVYRKIHGEAVGMFASIEDEFIPMENSASTVVEYIDLTAKLGILYDYKVVPFDLFGFQGKDSIIAERGFIYPEPYDFEVSQGLNSSTKPYDLIRLTWKISHKIFYKEGSVDKFYVLGVDDYLMGKKFSVPDDFSYSVSPTLGVPEFENLKTNVFKPSYKSYISQTNPFRALVYLDNKKADNSELEINPALTMGFTKDENDNSLFKKNSDNEWTYYYFLRVKNISEVDDPPEGFIESWYSPYYFRVAAKYNSNTSLEYTSNMSSIFRGCSVDPNKTATLVENGSAGFSVLKVGNNITVTINTSNWTIGNTSGTCGYSGWVLYKKVPGDIIYAFVGKKAGVTGTVVFDDTVDSSIFNPGEKVFYRVGIYGEIGSQSVPSDRISALSVAKTY